MTNKILIISIICCILFVGFLGGKKIMQCNEKKQIQFFIVGEIDAVKSLNVQHWQVGLTKINPLKKLLLSTCKELIDGGRESAVIELYLQGTTQLCAITGQPLLVQIARKIKAKLECDAGKNIIVTDMAGEIYQLKILKALGDNSELGVLVNTAGQNINYATFFKPPYTTHKEILSKQEAMFALEILIASIQQIIKYPPRLLSMSESTINRLMNNNALQQLKTDFSTPPKSITKCA